MYLFVEFRVRLVIAAVQNSDTLLCTQLLHTFDVRMITLVLCSEAIEEHKVGRGRSGRSLRKLNTLIVFILHLLVCLASNRSLFLEWTLLSIGHALPALTPSLGYLDDAFGIRVLLLELCSESIQEENVGRLGSLWGLWVLLFALLATLREFLLGHVCWCFPPVSFSNSARGLGRCVLLGGVR